MHLLIHHVWKYDHFFLFFLHLPFLWPCHTVCGVLAAQSDWTCFTSIGNMEGVLTSGLAGKALLFLFFSFLPYSFSSLIFFLLYQKRLFISFFFYFLKKVFEVKCQELESNVWQKRQVRGEGAVVNRWTTGSKIKQQWKLELEGRIVSE